MAKKTFPWHDKISNPLQLGGIETSVLDDGLGRGTRIAWVNTGPLRYKVVLDRAMDIADTFYNQHSLVWISHSGVTRPRPDANRGLEWLYSFFGGLLVTCGLSHTGGPETDEFGERGLHGRIANIPASIESIIQPDPANGKLDMSITGVVRETKVFGPSLEMRRTISSTLGEPAVRIHDVVTNHGNSATPLMLLYHCNFGWPLVDDGTRIVCPGLWKSFRRDMDGTIFNGKHDYLKCGKPLEAHRAEGESCAYVDVKAGRGKLCQIGLYNRKLNMAMAMRYRKDQLPWLCNWQHWGPGEYVTALEPGTNPPLGQSTVRRTKKLVFLAPGRSRTFDLEISVLTESKAVRDFAKM
jgi:hypothetical protein